jgi:hypothetical protein
VLILNRKIILIRKVASRLQDGLRFQKEQWSEIIGSAKPTDSCLDGYVNPGEARWFCCSRGTDGKPKGWRFMHCAAIAGILLSRLSTITATAAKNHRG